MPARWAKETIRRSRIKISLLDDMNDPFELLGVELDNREDREAWRKTRAYLARTKGVLCFSKNNRNPVLWSHYAEKHRGMCLTFEVPDHLTANVSYEAKLLPAKFAARRAKGTLDDAFMLKILTTKFQDWAYEDEIRMFCDLSKAHREKGMYFQDIGNELRLVRVTLGARCTTRPATLTSIVNGYPSPVNVVKARLAFREYAVVRQKRVKIRTAGGGPTPPDILTEVDFR